MLPPLSDDDLMVRYHSVLVPLDGSDLALGAIVSARALAMRFGAQVHTISVVSDTVDANRRSRQAADALGIRPGGPRISVVVGR
jgi:nucleotide-binding universal stress UspA family protein